MTEQVFTGIFTLVGTLLGVAVGLFGGRWVRTWGKVVCKLDWSPTMGTYSAQGHFIGTARTCQSPPGICGSSSTRAPVPLLRPQLEVAEAEGGPEDLGILPPHVHVTRTVNVYPGRNEDIRQRAVEEADRVEFVAIMDGAKDIREELAPWGRLPDNS